MALQSKRCDLALAQSLLALERLRQRRWVCNGSPESLSVMQLQELVHLGSIKVPSMPCHKPQVETPA